MDFRFPFLASVPIPIPVLDSHTHLLIPTPFGRSNTPGPKTKPKEGMPLLSPHI